MKLYVWHELGNFVPGPKYHEQGSSRAIWEHAFRNASPEAIALMLIHGRTWYHSVMGRYTVGFWKGL